MSPPREGEPVGSTKQGISKTYAWNNEHVPFTKYPLPQKKIYYVFAEKWGFEEASTFTKIRGINCSLQYCELNQPSELFVV